MLLPAEKIFQHYFLSGSENDGYVWNKSPGFEHLSLQEFSPIGDKRYKAFATLVGEPSATLFKWLAKVGLERKFSNRYREPPPKKTLRNHIRFTFVSHKGGSDNTYPRGWLCAAIRG